MKPAKQLPGASPWPRGELRAQCPYAQSGNPGAYYPGRDTFWPFSRRVFVGQTLSTSPFLGPCWATSCKLVTMAIAACSCQTSNGGTSRAPPTGSVES